MGIDPFTRKKILNKVYYFFIRYWYFSWKSCNALRSQKKVLKWTLWKNGKGSHQVIERKKKKVGKRKSQSMNSWMAIQAWYLHDMYIHNKHQEVSQ